MSQFPLDQPWTYLAGIAVCVVSASLWVRLRQRSALRYRDDLEKQVAARTRELEKLAELTERVNQAMHVAEVLDHLYESLRELIPYDRIGLALLDEERLVLRAVWSRAERSSTGIPVGYAAEVKTSSLGRVLEHGEPRIIGDLVEYLEEHPDSESTRRIVSEGVRSSLTVPLRVRGQAVGSLFFSSYAPHKYDESHIRFINQIAGQISLVVTKTKLYDDLLETKARLEQANSELEALATVDGLTGLANRRAFDAALDREWRRAVRARTPLSLLMIDVDFFKSFNDRYGHLAGDDCLRTVATVLAASVRRAGDVAARYGGEEFAVLLPGSPPGMARMLADGMRMSIEKLGCPHEHSSISPFVTASVGIATLFPAAGGNGADLIRLADDALYVAKSMGRNRVHVSSAQLIVRRPPGHVGMT